MIDLDFLLSIGKIVQFNKNEVVFMQNDFGPNMYIVLKGSFGVYINSFSDFPIRIACIEQGSFFGEMAIIDGWPRSATIISEDAGAALSIDKENFELVLEKNPDIAQGILSTLQKRAEVMVETVRISGREAPLLSNLLMSAEFTDAKRDIPVMVALAKQVRHMNDLLTTDKSVLAFNKGSTSSELIRLLPDKYVPFNLNEPNDNYRLINAQKGVCPYCGQRQTVFVPSYSRLLIDKSTLDQRITYKNIKILWYSNSICSNCNYTGAYQEFVNSYESYDGVKYTGNQFKNVEGFTGFTHNREHSLDEVFLSYYLRLACAERTSTSTLPAAKAWLRLYWLYSDCNIVYAKLKAADKAHSCYAQYLNEYDCQISVDNKIRINAILGELSIEMGNIEQAKEHFEEAAYLGRLVNNSLLGQTSPSSHLVTQCLARYSEIRGL